MEITQIPTAQLVPHENNAHTELRGIDELAQTIEYLGIIEPLVVLPADDDSKHTIIAGHRRHAAALQVELETVPCIVAADRDAADQIVIMLVENLHRDGLTATEEAKAYEQLALLDWEPERIAKATGRDVERVQGALTLRKLPEQIQQAADADQLDLVTAASLTEFAHDPKAMKRIIKKGEGHWSYQHAIADERARQAARDELERVKAELVLAGVKITPQPTFTEHGGIAVRVEHLVDGDGNPVDIEQVKDKAGFAAYINRDYQPKPVYYCPDPAAVGLRPAPDTWQAQIAEREALEAEAEALRTAWEAATGVRREFLVCRFGTAKGAKKLFRTALRHLAGTRMNMPVHDVRELADAICGCPIKELPENAGMDRLTRATVARWLADCEDNLKASAIGRWGDFQHALDYFDLLIAEGYELAEIEVQLHQAITDALSEDDEAEAEEATDEEVDQDHDSTVDDPDDGEPDSTDVATPIDAPGDETGEATTDVSPVPVPAHDSDLVAA